MFSIEDTLAQWIMMVFTMVAAVLLLGTLRATRIMANDTSLMARESRRVGELQTRAFLIECGVKITNLTVGAEPKVTVTFKNCGNTPALSVSLLYNLQIFKVGSVEMRSFSGRKASTTYPLVSGGSFNCDIDGIGKIDARDFGAFKNKTELIVASVRISYTDAFRKQRRTICCFQSDWRPDGKPRMIHASNGNRAS